MGETISVLLASSNPTLRLGLLTLLEQEPDLIVPGEVEDGKKALAQIGLLRPNVALLDYLLPRLSAVEVAEEVQRRSLPTRIVVLCDHSDEKLVYRLVVAGVAGCLVVDEAPENIIAAVRATARGEAWFSLQAATDLVSCIVKAQERSIDLTQRELMVLGLVAKGMRNKEIARVLHISKCTVEYHVSNILGKLGVQSRVEATGLGIRARTSSSMFYLNWSTIA